VKLMIGQSVIMAVGWLERQRDKERKNGRKSRGKYFFFLIFAPDFLLLSRHEILIYL
jgi:hypothetical protein